MAFKIMKGDLEKDLYFKLAKDADGDLGLMVSATHGEEWERLLFIDAHTGQVRLCSVQVTNYPGLLFCGTAIHLAARA